ncbi:lipase 1-like isoform X2 [Sitodiplosis mosellana]|nr:lipase 1-like isoform X2 [Sitodiplosis mosellana]XP_055316504.1 lipase 1-like isoform X2 [Sitodiplosis mosellana]
MTTPQMITYYGYVVVEFEVTTDDGYILTIFYMYSSKYVNDTLTPIILQPGMYDDTDSLCIHPYSLAYYLADRGYRVALYNPRGNSYSLDHETLDSSIPDGPYWGFTWYEMGIYDLPATINKVLSITGAKRVSLIGHSEGGTIIFVLLSERPEFNGVVKFFACMAPFTFMKNVGFPINAALKLVHLYNGNRNFSFVQNTPAQRAASLFFCTMANGEICNTVINSIYGPSVGQRDAASNALFPCHWPAGGSFGQIYLFSDEYAKKYFGHMNADGSHSDFILRNINTTFAVFYSSNDPHTNQNDVDSLYNSTPSVITKIFQNIPQFNHIDFLFAKTAPELVYNRIVTIELSIP